MKTYLLIFATALFSVSTFAQIDQRRIMASAGRIAKDLTPSAFGPNYIMSYTLGEPFIYVGTPVGLPTKKFFNGFQQPDALIPVGPGTTALMPAAPIFNIYPNPFDQYSIIEAPQAYEKSGFKTSTD